MPPVQSSPEVVGAYSLAFLQQASLSTLFRLWFDVQQPWWSTFNLKWKGFSTEEFRHHYLKAPHIAEKVEDAWKAAGKDLARDLTQRKNLLVDHPTTTQLAAKIDYLIGDLFGSQVELLGDSVVWKRCAIWETLKAERLDKVFDCYHCCSALAEGLAQAVSPDLIFEQNQHLPRGSSVCQRLWQQVSGG